MTNDINESTAMTSCYMLIINILFFLVAIILVCDAALCSLQDKTICLRSFSRSMSWIGS